ncbi:MAG: ATP-binding cassette domain-containing protein [Rhodobacteraceae bacterium]|nr:ATP-binding cassette domain-containing protein [Paracoccaceae bacterium]
MKLVEIQKVSVQLGGNKVLLDVDLVVNSGEIITIVGPNGSGKSTLLRVIIGAISPTSGTIKKTDDLRIGYVPQRLHIDPTLPMTVNRFLKLPHRISTAEAVWALEQAGVSGLGEKQMSLLSGGQFQRVLLARALMGQPQILILDEATQGLDRPGAASFYQQIEDVRQRMGCAVLMVSHDLHVVMSASDRVICLNRHICCEGAPEYVASAPEYRALFGEGTQGALALYRHHHSHTHDHSAHGDS